MKPIATGLPILVLLCLLAACGVQHGQQQPATASLKPALPAAAPEKAIVSEEELAHYSPEMRAIYDRGVLRVAVYSQDRNPFFYVDENGKLVGSDVELATDMAAQFGVEAAFIRTAQSFEQVVEQVASGEADIAVSKLSATLSRAKVALFSQPYLALRQGLLVNRLQAARMAQPNIPLLETLQTVPAQIGVIAGTSYVRFARELFPQAGLPSFQSTQDMLDAALKGDITAIFYDELQLKNMLESNPTHSIELQLLMMDGQLDLISVAVSPGHTQLLEWINLYLQTNRTKIAALLDRYGIPRNAASAQDAG